MKYTTLENLTRKLRGRLNIQSQDTTSIYPIANPNQLVDNKLIESTVEEKEYFLDLILDRVYVLPLKNQHPIIRDIVDSLVIADLMSVHFQGSSGFGGLGSDLSSTGIGAKNHAYSLIDMLVAGSNLKLPGMPPSTYMPYPPGSLPPNRIVLPGETLREKTPDSVLVNNETFIDKYEESEVVTVNSRYIIEAQQKDNPFSMDFKEKKNA